MPAQNARLQLFILFLLLINGCQQGTAVSPSSSSAGTFDTNTTMKNDKFDELMNKMDEMMKQNIELKNGMEKMKEELKAELNEMKKLMKNKEEIGGFKEKDIKLNENSGLKEEDKKLKGKTNNEIVKLTEMFPDLKAMKNNKLNEADRGPDLNFSENKSGEEILKYTGSYLGWRTVRAILPSTYNFHDKNPSIASYFEVKILNTGHNNGCVIGFCDKQFPLKSEMLGNLNNSIGIRGKGLMLIEGKTTKLGNADEGFSAGDFVGIGIIHKPNYKMECFATWNGKLLGKIELKTEFISTKLFPAVSLLSNEFSVVTNFGKHDWHFTEFEHLLA